MGFMKQIFSNNEANLLVAFGGDQPTPSYTPTDSIQEALEYFNLYVQDGRCYAHTDEEEIYDTLGLENKQEVEELRTSLNTIIATLPDDAAKDHIILFKEWKAGVDYAVGDRVRYNQGLFKVLQAHTSQADWTPSRAPSLFATILNPNPDIIEEWIQPDSTNGYATGDKVLHNGETWISTADNNVWEPGAVGAPWRNVNEPESESEPEVEPTNEVPEWVQPDSNSAYNTGDRVTYNGVIYESTIDNNVWSPADYPAGWTVIEG